jgi:hypothetical protein
MQHPVEITPIVMTRARSSAALPGKQLLNDLPFPIHQIATGQGCLLKSKKLLGPVDRRRCLPTGFQSTPNQRKAVDQLRVLRLAETARKARRGCNQPFWARAANRKSVGKI